MESIVDDQENFTEFLEEADLLQYFELFRDILKVNKLSQLKYVNVDDLGQIGLSKPEQRRYKKIISKYYPNTYFSKIKKLLTTNKKNDVFSLSHGSSSIDLQPFFDNVKGSTKHIISIEDITINKELGTGQFGIVQQGTWTTGNHRLQVAIKCLGNERMTSNSTEFLKEAAVMHSIEHPKIVRLYGVVLHLDSLMLVTELAPLRSLLECLRDVTLRPHFPVTNLCDFAQQICEGMTYLENKRLIHRDLAARNILVFSKDRVKISDFGLSRALGVGKDYYQTNYNVNLKLPVAWCAPECILYLRFTSASDVWAFGVCLWEMFTYGFQPWVAFSGQQILEAIDAPNFQRLERPECCPDEYYTTMLECWSHDPNKRPIFKDLGLKLYDIQPKQVQAIANFKASEAGRRSNFLEFKVGEIITVLGKESRTKTSLWYGVLPGGTSGLFDPFQTKPYVKSVRARAGSLSPHPARNSSRSLRPSILRSDVKRHTYTGKRTIQRSMISSPQGDVKHTGHVGLDGAYFGDISFLDSAGCPKQQFLTPYKPTVDLEQVPLLHPSSPSHLSGATCTSPYPMLTASHSNNKKNCDEVNISNIDKNLKKSHLKSVSESTSSKSILNKVKSATSGRSNKSDEDPEFVPKREEVHEYQEISDTDMECTPAGDNFVLTDSPVFPLQKSCTDFGQSLLDEMESMFRNLDGRKRDTTSKHSEVDNAVMSHTLSKAEKKKILNTSTMKPMSAHDEKTLNTAVALANEITTKSMNDLGCDQKAPSSPNDRSKFHFKFPLVSLHHNPTQETYAAGKHERRNFSEEAKSVPDIQSTITKESKHAYTSLIEDPTPSTSLIPHMELYKPATIPKPTPRLKESRANFLSLQKQISYTNQPVTMGETVDHEITTDDIKNELPLPPRNTKPKLVDKPRHIRKYPLKLPNTDTNINKSDGNDQTELSIVYQNAMMCSQTDRKENKVVKQNEQKKGVDVSDGPKADKVDRNPFTNSSGSNSANPFNCYLKTIISKNERAGAKDGEQYFEKGSLVKDHVSVEDLLEFADLKPCGRQRGAESDEVRIMNKVLKEQATLEECLEALELSDWDIHHAIKVIRVKVSVSGEVSVTLDDCSRELLNSAGDIVKASALLVLCNNNE